MAGEFATSAGFSAASVLIDRAKAFRAHPVSLLVEDGSEARFLAALLCGS